MNEHITEESSVVNLERETKGWSLQKFLPSLQLLVTIGIAVGGFLVSTKVDTTKLEIDKANQKLTEITTKFEKNKKFADEVNTAIDQLSGEKPVKAKMTLIRLYTFADTENPTYKYVLVNLALASDKPELLETMTALLEGDNPQGIDESVFKKYPVLAAARAKLARKIEKEGAVTQQELNTGQPITSNSQNKPSSKAETLVKAEASLLSQLTSKDLKGWVFLGRANRKTKTLESDIISGSQLDPKINQEVTVTQSINIRLKRPPNNYTLNNLPKLIGTSRKGSKVKIIKVSRVYSESGNIGVWAEVEVIEKV
ncbi:MAG: hypothetical protein KME42_27515 [Tildeniella nuda ZEHNDER 1965/U140]|jgi:hypothetical protein|nr:hypothetical protein [Tildeniella nuda ZEHNDER 1965/U140]